MRNNNKKLGIFLLVALLSLSNSAIADENIDYGLTQDVSFEKIRANKDTIVKAKDAMNEKDYQTAITLLTGYLNEKPKNYDAYKLRGDAYYAIRRYDLAQEDYQKAVKLKSADDKLMTNTKYVTAIVLGADKNEQLQNAELGDFYGALMYAQKALNNPAYLTSYENALKYNSHIYLPQPNKNEINKINCPQKYGKVLNPKGIDEKIYGAINDIENANYNESLYKLQSVTAELPNYYLGYYLTGVALSELEKDDDAIKSFEKAVALNPFDFESYASLGQIYYSKAETTFSQDDAQKSIDYFQKAIRLNDNCPTYYFYIGMNELQNGNINVAIANFDKAIKINPDDYNSIYYKLIAQYINGKYQDVVDGTTKLVYRHVSNYNSVLYLRALAYTKLGQSEKALQDLDAIENNIEDIYNSDIKKTTAREKSLETYIHYLKAQIQNSKGAGAASDKTKAYSNPIIDRLANAEKSIAPYEQSLQGDSISINDYVKFEKFYSTALPKLLESGAVITYEDIDNQYDYIRTTFADLGISFLYTNPDYKLTTIKDYPYKKYSSKLSAQDRSALAARSASEVQNVELARAQAEILRSSTPQSELLSQEGQLSLAQMLASNVLEENKKLTPKQASVRPTVSDTKLNEDMSKAEFKPEVPDAEKINTSKNIASGEIYESSTPAVSTDNSKKVTEILHEEKSISDGPLNQQSPIQTNIETAQDGSIKISVKEPTKSADLINNSEKSLVTSAKDIKNNSDRVIDEKVATAEPMVFTAENIKQTDDIVIKYPSAKSVENLTSQARKDVSYANDAVSKAVTNSNKVASTAISATEDTKNQLEKLTKETVKEPLFKENDEIIPYRAESTIWNTQKPDAMREIQEELQGIIAESEQVSKPPKEIVEKHAKINMEEFDSQNKQKSFVVDSFDDIVELDVSGLNKKIGVESDLFTQETVFGKPQNAPKDIMPAVTLPEEPFIPNMPKSKVQTTDDNASENLIAISTTQKSELPQEVVVPELRTNETSNIKEAINSSQESAILETNKNNAEAQLSKIIDEILPQNEMKEEFSSIESEQIIEPTINEVELVKADKLRLKEEAKLAKAQKKAEKLKLKEELKLKKQEEKMLTEVQKAELNEQKAKLKEEKQKVKQEIKQAKVLAKEQKKLAQIQAKSTEEKSESWLKTTINKIHKKESYVDKSIKKQEKEAKKLAKAQAKIVEQNDETKIQRLKTRLLLSKNNTLSKEEKLAQKAQLKAERAAAKEQYKANKAAKKAQLKAQKIQNKAQNAEKEVANTIESDSKKFSIKKIFSKMKFWKKK